MGLTYITLQSNLQVPSALSSLLSDEKNKGDKNREAQENPNAFSTGLLNCISRRQRWIPGSRVIEDSQRKKGENKQKKDNHFLPLSDNEISLIHCQRFPLMYLFSCDDINSIKPYHLLIQTSTIIN